MIKLIEISKNLLLEDDSKLMMLKKAITKRIPITIDYRDPSPEVLDGIRYDIEPIVMGNNFRSGNLVIWAYVFKGTSKKGIPNWKMFRVDRINSIRFNPSTSQFNVNKLPGYVKGKAPDAMKSLSNVITFSPYWYDERDMYKIGRPQQKKIEPEIPEIEPEIPEIEPQQVKTEPEIEKVEPQISSTDNLQNYYSNILSNRIKKDNNQNLISQEDYELAVRELYNEKQGQWKNYQRNISGNLNPGEGTRKKFDREARAELDQLLTKNNVKVNNHDMLSEIKKRFKYLIK